MGMRVTDLSCKEVVCISDGARLGYVSDVEVEVPCGQVKAIVVPGKCRCMGLLNPREDYVIPWSCICRIGPDIVLVDTQPDTCRCHRAKPRLPF